MSGNCFIHGLILRNVVQSVPYISLLSVGELAVLEIDNILDS